MNFIGKVTDEDVGEKIKEINMPKKRRAVRAILINEKGEIALLNKAKKNEYKLVGGGVDEGETLEKALEREILEETGCEIKVIESLGYIEEEEQEIILHKLHIYIYQKLLTTQKYYTLQKRRKKKEQNYVGIKKKML